MEYGVYCTLMKKIYGTTLPFLPTPSSSHTRWKHWHSFVIGPFSSFYILFSFFTPVFPLFLLTATTISTAFFIYVRFSCCVRVLSSVSFLLFLVKMEKKNCVSSFSVHCYSHHFFLSVVVCVRCRQCSKSTCAPISFFSRNTHAWYAYFDTGEMHRI